MNTFTFLILYLKFWYKLFFLIYKVPSRWFALLVLRIGHFSNRNIGFEKTYHTQYFFESLHLKTNLWTQISLKLIFFKCLQMIIYYYPIDDQTDCKSTPFIDFGKPYFLYVIYQINMILKFILVWQRMEKS